jgi:hypothetical protein
VWLTVSICVLRIVSGGTLLIVSADALVTVLTDVLMARVGTQAIAFVQSVVIGRTRDVPLVQLVEPVEPPLVGLIDIADLALAEYELFHVFCFFLSAAGKRTLFRISL